MKTEHILIIRFSAMGDVAMLVPVVHALATQYPHIRVTVLSRKFARTMFENLSPNVGFMEAEFKKEYQGVKGLNALYRRLKAKNFTGIADMHGVLRSEYIRMRFNIDRYKTAHIDKHRKGKRQLIAPENKKLVQQPTSFQNYADVLAELGYPVKPDFRSIFGESGGDLSMIPAEFHTKKTMEKWIGIAPFAAHEGKVYPIQLMEKVISLFEKQHPDWRIFFFGGGKNETEIFQTWCDKHGNCTNASARLGGLYQELILMSHLDAMISMDSANMHLASLVATPVVSVWGATHPYAGFMGWNQSIGNAIQLDLPCRPCSIYGNKPCIRGDLACLQNINPEQIVQKTELIIRNK